MNTVSGFLHYTPDAVNGKVINQAYMLKAYFNRPKTVSPALTF